MEVSMTCKHCGKRIDASDEDALVTGVQAHARSHDGGPTLTRDHILARLHRLQRREHGEH